MLKDKITYKNYLYIFWALFLIVAILLTLNTKTTTISSYYDKEIEASNLLESCFSEIKNYNIERGTSKSSDDIFDSYLIGTKNQTLITTTSGNIYSKRSTINPNFAGLFVKMMTSSNVKEGDDICVCVSGSFPCLNLACLCAAETMNLNVCLFSTIGSSEYGANDPDFTFYDWLTYLNTKGLISYKCDLVSFGGEYDTGEEMGTGLSFISKSSDEINEMKNEIVNRVRNNGDTFYIESDYEKNISYRMNLVNEKCNNLKMFINVGGNIIGLGLSDSSKYYLSGIIEPSYTTSSTTYDSKTSGLIERYLINGITCISMLNIKGICKKYNIEYNPSVMPEVDSSLDIYYDIKYKKYVPIIALSISSIILVYTLVTNYKNNKVRGKEYE